MLPHLTRRTFAAALCCAALFPRRTRADDEGPLFCSVCGRAIEGRYIVSNDQVFCSEACFHQTLPKCNICGEPVLQGGQIAGHTYCQTCLNRHAPCFSCGLPAAHATQLADGRRICPDCMRWAVIAQESAQHHYNRARQQLEASTSLRHTSVPKLQLVNKQQMYALEQSIRKTDTPISTRGIYSRQTTLRKRGLFGAWRPTKQPDQETIYLIDHLHDTIFRVAATHELMHDLVYEHFPRLETAPLWVHEGICQHAAADLCRRRGYHDALYGIEQCTDPDYGDGYRHVAKLAGASTWPALRKWMQTVDVDALPARAPRSSPP